MFDPHHLTSGLLQGPLAGYSTAPFRSQIWDFGAVDCCATEMISVKSILHNYDFVKARYLARAANETALCAQLSATDPEELALAVKKISDLPIDTIDLNCGCPKPKIRSKGAGSKLLAKPTLLAQLIESLRNSTALPISIKIRVDADSGEKCNDALIQIINDSGLDYLIVHGRHWQEDYETTCHYEEIQHFVESINVPVIGNGDIDNIHSLNRMLDAGCAGVMVSRASVGRPWLFQALQHARENKPFPKPSDNEIKRLFFEQVEGLAELLDSEKFALLHARKLAKYFSKSLDNADGFFEQVIHAQHLNELLTK